MGPKHARTGTGEYGMTVAMPLLAGRKPELHYRIDDFTDPWREAGTVLLQHGFARSSKFWHAFVPHLA